MLCPLENRDEQDFFTSCYKILTQNPESTEYKISKCKLERLSIILDNQTTGRITKSVVQILKEKKNASLQGMQKRSAGN